MMPAIPIRETRNVAVNSDVRPCTATTEIRSQDDPATAAGIQILEPSNAVTRQGPRRFQRKLRAWDELNHHRLEAGGFGSRLQARLITLPRHGSPRPPW